jgi:hypothetical protein
MDLILRLFFDFGIALGLCAWIRQAFGEMVTASMFNSIAYWAQLIQNIFVIIASLIAIYGIRAWRREFIGKRKIELAEEVLALFYEARDIIKYIRNPGGGSKEGSSREPEGEETPLIKEARDRAFVPIERYNKHRSTFSKLDSLKYRFVAYFGKDAAAPFDDLRGILNEIFLAARRLARYWSSIESGTQITEEQDKKRDMNEAIIWEDEAERDPINPKIDDIIGQIDRMCKEFIH